LTKRKQHHDIRRMQRRLNRNVLRDSEFQGRWRLDEDGFQYIDGMVYTQYVFKDLKTGYTQRAHGWYQIWDAGKLGWDFNDFIVNIRIHEQQL
jgi:hypothetical protein